MNNFWERKYNDLVAYLKNRYGPAWVLDALEEIKETGDEMNG